MTHSPGPWSVLDDDDCVLDANSHHIICFGHDYDQYGGFSATLPRQEDRMKKEIAVIEGNRELVRMAPMMLEDILKLRSILASAYFFTVQSTHERQLLLGETLHYEQYR